MKKLAPALLLLAAACGDDKLTQETPPPMFADDHSTVAVARKELVTVLDLHTKVIQRSCSPTGGVCHNGKEYPDLRTTGAMISSLSKPCNQDRFDEPHAIFDGCEPEADALVVGTGINEWRTKIGFLGPEETNGGRPTYRRLRTQDQAPRYLDRVPAKIMRGNEVLIDLPANVLLASGNNEGEIVDVYTLEYTEVQKLGRVRGGDPNSNGVFGADQPWNLVAPGHPDRSYLVGRITGTVPGTRMPLANHPLRDAEYVAIICWIETMSADPDANDKIDYDNCNFAKNPISYQIGPR